MPKKSPIKPENNHPPKEIRSASDLHGLKQERSVLIKRDAIDADARTVDLAFATETPVGRWYGYEILDCNPKSVRLDRLRSKAPILVGHDGDDHVGVIESASMDSDRTGRVKSRYSRSARGEEIFQDIVDEIRTNTSVGYVIHAAILEKEEEGVATYRITDWEPYEVSIVSMPADINSGVGRDLDSEPPTKPQKETRTMKKCEFCGTELADGVQCSCDQAVAKRQADADTRFNADRDKAVTQARDAELKRIKGIRDAGKQYSTRGGVELANELIDDANATVETFRERMLAKIDAEEKEKLSRANQDQSHQRIEAGLIYDKRSIYPFMRGAGNVQKDAERSAFRAGQWARAVIFGDAVAERYCKDQGIELSKRVMTSDDNTAGGYLVPDELEMAIIDLRAEYGVLRRLARRYPMSSGTLGIPVRKTGTSAYFPGQKTATAESDMGWGEVNLVAKDVSALTRLSNNLVEDAVIDIAAMVAEEHAYAFAVKEDSCLIDGDGTSAYGGIVGLKALLEVSGMAGIKTAASNSDTPQEIIEAEISGLMAKLPSYARMGSVFLSSPAFDELIFGRIMRAAGGNTTTTLGAATVPSYNGKPRVVCEPCYSDDTADLTGKAMAFYGNFTQGIAFGERRGIMVQVLRERYAEYRQIGVIGTERIDINCHGVGDTSAAGPIVALIGG